MLPVLFGAVALGTAALLALGKDGPGESFGGLGGPYVRLPDDGPWKVYRFAVPGTDFTVALHPGPNGALPRPRHPSSPHSWVYADGTPAVTQTGGHGGSCDLFVFHPQVEPSSFGAVSWWMGGRGPHAGVGLSPSDGGRQVGTPYAWADTMHSWPNDKYGGDDGEDDEDEDAVWDAETGRWTDPETGQIWVDEVMGWVDPLEAEERMGLNILGFNIPLSKEERMESLETKIENATSKLKELEKSATKEGADIDKLSKQIASMQEQIERWEERRNKLEVRMAGFSGLPDLDDMEAALFGIEADLGQVEEEIRESFGIIGIDDALIIGASAAVPAIIMAMKPKKKRLEALNKKLAKLEERLAGADGKKADRLGRKISKLKDRIARLEEKISAKEERKASKTTGADSEDFGLDEFGLEDDDFGLDEFGLEDDDFGLDEFGLEEGEDDDFGLDEFGLEDDEDFGRFIDDDGFQSRHQWLGGDGRWDVYRQLYVKKSDGSHPTIAFHPDALNQYPTFSSDFKTMQFVYPDGQHAVVRKNPNPGSFPYDHYVWHPDSQPQTLSSSGRPSQAGSERLEERADDFLRDGRAAGPPSSGRWP